MLIFPHLLIESGALPFGLIEKNALGNLNQIIRSVLAAKNPPHFTFQRSVNVCSDSGPQNFANKPSDKSAAHRDILLQLKLVFGPVCLPPPPTTLAEAHEIIDFLITAVDTLCTIYHMYARACGR